jgi:endo-1,4-beta-xylanase
VTVGGPGAVRTALAAALVVVGGCGGGPSGPDAVPSPSPSAGPPASEAPPLRDAAVAASRLIGAAVQSGFLADEPEYAATAARHFDYLTAEYEMKMDPIERDMGRFDFSGADAIVAFAEAHGMKVKGHALVWHGATPSWVSTLTSAEVRSAVETYVRTVAGRYSGRVHAWDVVNEAVADDGSGLRDTVFLRNLGPGYIADAFRLAHEADPKALLLYNDYGGEGLGAKSDRIYTLVKGLKEDGVPIDGVGLQMHVEAGGDPSSADLLANLQRLAALGLRVNISEMDVRIRNYGGASPAGLDAQRARYHDVVAACLAVPRCDAVTLWGLTDRHSWIDAFFGPDDPLLFDETYRAKPAFFGVQDALLGR